MGHLYRYLTKLPDFSTPQQRRVLSRRLREQLLKQWILNGIPRTIMAVLALAREESPEDADATFTRKDACMDEANRLRGVQFLKMLYGEDLDKIYQLWGAHAPDFIWLSENIIYGLFIGEEVVLNTVESELITYTAIACQNLGPTARIHLRGLRRCGVSLEDVENITKCAKIVAEWSGLDTSRWASITDMESADFTENGRTNTQGEKSDQYLGL